VTRLHSAFNSPETKRRYVRRLFSTIADRYDIVTVVLSYGFDRRWKRLLVEEAMRIVDFLPHTPKVLDLACGTGDIALRLSDYGIKVVGLDITPRMVEIATQKTRQASDSIASAFVVGDMMELPYPDDSFDLVTVGYGFRNVPVLDDALREVYRVLRPGGSVLSLDFNRPTNMVVSAVYLGYLTAVGALLGAVLHGDPDTYRYIPASLRHYPGAAGVSTLMRELTFSGVHYTPLLGGLMAINRGRK